jgi:formylglycine-generating enzyme required for sulfatase activity
MDQPGNNCTMAEPPPSPTFTYRHRQATVQFFEEPLGTDLALKMMHIPAGRFLMGSPEDEPERNSNEGPQHEVQVPEFFIGKYPVTQAEWRWVAGNLTQVNRELKPTPITL